MGQGYVCIHRGRAEILDAKTLHQLEDWSIAANGNTSYLPTVENFLERIAGQAKKIASLHREKEPLSSTYKRRLKDSYVDTLCLVFDGMLSVAAAPDEPTDGRRQSRVAIVRTSNKDVVRCVVIVLVSSEDAADQLRKHAYCSRSPTLAILNATCYLA